MSTDESSLLSVGSARNRWEQMALESSSKEDPKAPPPVRKRPNSFVTSSSVTEGIRSSDDTDNSGTPAVEVSSGLDMQSSGPSLVTAAPRNNVSSAQRPSTPEATPAVQNQGPRTTPHTGINSGKVPPPVKPKPKPLIAKKPAHLSATPVGKSTPPPPPPPSKNQPPERTPNAPRNDSHASHQGVETEVGSLEKSLGQMDISDHNTASAPEIKSHLKVPGEVATELPVSQPFVPPPFRKLSPGILPSPDSMPPPPPVSRPVTPLGPNRNSSSAFVPPRTPENSALTIPKSPIPRGFVPPKSPAKSPGLSPFRPPKSPAINAFVPPKSPAPSDAASSKLTGAKTFVLPQNSLPHAFVPPKIHATMNSPSLNSLATAPTTAFVPPKSPVTLTVEQTTSIIPHPSIPPALPIRDVIATATVTEIASTPAPAALLSAASLPSMNSLPEASSFMPPPPLPRFNTFHAVVPKAVQDASSLQVPKPSTSPAPPPPPPSRKLNASISPSNLNGVSPLPSPSELTQYQAVPPPAHIYQPQPRQPLGEALSVSPIPLPTQLTPASSLSPTNAPLANTTASVPASIPYQPPPPPQRHDYFGHAPQAARSSVSLHETQALRKTSIPNSDYNSDADEELFEDEQGVKEVTAAEYVSYPDSSHANRRAPIYGGPIHEFSTKNRVEAVGIYGDILIVSSTFTKVIDLQTGNVIWTFNHSDVKVCTIGFKPSADLNMQGRIAWLGTKEGHLWEIDIDDQAILHKRSNAHMSAISVIEPVGKNLWTISEDGKVCVWDRFINDTPKAFRMAPNFKALCIVDDTIWCGRNRQIHVYHPTPTGDEQFNLTSRPLSCFPLAPGKAGGDFTCAAYLKSFPDYVLFGHEDGTVTVFSRSKNAPIESINISIHRICSMVGIGTNLWIGFKSGHIFVVDISVKPWRIIKEWKAHESTVRNIAFNFTSFYTAQQTGLLPAISVGPESAVYLWDGLLKTDWIGKLLLNFFPFFVY